MNKKELAVKLSRLKVFEKTDVKLEQYPTDSEIAADAVWKAYMQGDVKGKSLIDLGCGHGVLGIGALLLKAEKVRFVDLDKDALKIAKENLKSLKKRFNAVFSHKNVKDIKAKADVVIQNPPFGVKTTHSDKMFLLKAMNTAPVVYSFHKLSTRKFVEKVAEDHGFKAKLISRYKFPLKKTMWFHFKKIHYVDVGLWRVEKKI